MKALRELKVSTALPGGYMDPNSEEVVVIIPNYWLFTGVGIIEVGMITLLMERLYPKSKIV